MIDRRCYISTWASLEGRPPFEPWAAAAAVAQMTAGDPESAILEDGDATTAVVVTDHGSSSVPTKLQLLALRKFEDRPLQYTPGEALSAINLPDGYFTADITHVVLWPSGFAAQDFHGDAPRLSRLAVYLRRKTSMTVQFDSLYDPSITERLEEIAGQIRSVDIALTSPERSAAVSQGVFSNLFPSAFGDRAPSISVKLGMGRYGPRDRYLDSNVQEAALSVAENASELVDRMVIVGRSKRTGRTVRLNLLNERLGDDVELQPASEGSSLPDTDSAFSELERVYGEIEASGGLEEAVRAQAMRPA